MPNIFRSLLPLAVCPELNFDIDFRFIEGNKPIARDTVQGRGLTSGDLQQQFELMSHISLESTSSRILNP